MASATGGSGARILKPLLLLLPSLLLLVLVELTLHITEDRWKSADEMAPSFVLERQGGLLEIQRRISDEAGTGAGGLLASERMYRSDGHLFWRLHPNLDLEARNYLVPREWGEPTPFTIQTNGSGLRMTRSPGSNKKGVRIICMGNSCTFGWGVDSDGTYPSQLEQLIVSRVGLRGVEVWNAGMPGYTSHQGIRFFEADVALWQPDIVVLSFGFNDSRMAATSDEELQRRRQSMTGRIAALASRLRTYRFLESRIRQEGRVPEAQSRKVPRVSAADYGRNLARAVDAARERGITPVLLALVMPEEYRREIGRVSDEKEVPLVAPIPAVLAVGEALSRGEVPPGFAEIDLPENLAGADPREIVFDDPIHPNRLGNYMIAMQITHNLLTTGLLDEAARAAAR